MPDIIIRPRYLYVSDYNVFFKDIKVFSLKDDFKYFKEDETAINSEEKRYIPLNPNIFKFIVRGGRKNQKQKLYFKNGYIEVCLRRENVQALDRDKIVRMERDFYVYNIIEPIEDVRLNNGSYFKTGYYMSFGNHNKVDTFMEALFSGLEEAGYNVISDTKYSDQNFFKLYKDHPEVYFMDAKELANFRVVDRLANDYNIDFGSALDKNTIYFSMGNNVMVSHLNRAHTLLRKFTSVPVVLFRPRSMVYTRAEIMYAYLNKIHLINPRLSKDYVLEEIARRK